MNFTDATKAIMAKTLCPRMDDADMWDVPPPPCTGEAHAWEVCTDWEVIKWFSDAKITSRYPWAVVCSICGIGVGIS